MAWVNACTFFSNNGFFSNQGKESNTNSISYPCLYHVLSPCLTFSPYLKNILLTTVTLKKNNACVFVFCVTIIS